jgi:hypothetical protein
MRSGEYSRAGCCRRHRGGRGGHGSWGRGRQRLGRVGSGVVVRRVVPGAGLLPGGGRADCGECQRADIETETGHSTDSEQCISFSHSTKKRYNEIRKHRTDKHELWGNNALPSNNPEVFYNY